MASTSHSLIVVASFGRQYKTTCLSFPSYEEGRKAFDMYAPIAFRTYLQGPDGQLVAKGDNNCIR